MKYIFAILILLSSFSITHAQNATQDQKTDIQKERRAEAMRTMLKEGESRNRLFHGSPYTNLHLETTTGEKINWNTSVGKVTLLAFWEPTCHYDLAKLNELVHFYKDKKQFQLLVVTFDTSGLAEMTMTQKLELKFAVISSVQEMHELNYNNGYPSFVILDKENIVSRIGSLHKFDEQKDLISDLLQF